MQSLIHGNFEGAAQTKVYAMVGAARRSRAVGPLLGGFITTYLSWRVASAGGGDHRVVLSGWAWSAARTPAARRRIVGAALSVPRMAAWYSAAWSGRRAASTAAR